MHRLPRLSPARVALLIAAIAVGYFVFSAIGDTILSQQLSQEERQLHDEIDELAAQQIELQAIRDYLATSEYVENVARRVLGLARPGETIFIVGSSAEPTPAPTAGADDGYTPWWERLYGP